MFYLIKSLIHFLFSLRIESLTVSNLIDNNPFRNNKCVFFDFAELFWE